MKIVVCIDDNNGLLFNNRRQSSDMEVINDILRTTKGNLLINSFSKNLFRDCPCVIADDLFLHNVKEDAYCFVENISIKNYKDKINELIIYHWNRLYPADMFFDMDLSQFTLVSRTEFAGKSHKKITKEVYAK